jgi:RNA polymerase sigma factor (sigma-70 family)
MQTEAVEEVGPVHVSTAQVTTGQASAGQASAGQASAGQAGTGAAAQWVPPTWEEVVRDHSARVYRLAYRLTGNCHDAEDLTQEVFVRVFRSLPSYTPGTFEGWLHRITTNLFLDITRRRQRIRFEGLGEETAARLKGTEPTPSQAFDDRHLDHDIAVALADLPPEYRAAVVLCDIEGLTYEEIADVLGVKLGTVRSRIHRGRAQLRAALEHRRPKRGTVVRRRAGEAPLLSRVAAREVPAREVPAREVAAPKLPAAELPAPGLPGVATAAEVSRR